MKIVIDLETTGFPKTKLGGYYDPSDTEKYDNSRIIQIGYIVINDNNTELLRNSMYVKPDGFTIDNSWVHNITDEIASEKGHCFKYVMGIFENDIFGCDTIISHNIKFDYNVLLSECHRYGLTGLIEKLEGMEKYCTMLNGKEIMNMRKWPKLTELYEYLYDAEFKQKHDALDDAHFCYQCYKKMVKV